MITENYFENNQDLQFVLEHYLDYDRIVPLREQNYHDAEEYKKTEDEMLQFAPANVDEAKVLYHEAVKQLGEIAGKEVAPYAQKMDHEGLKLKDGKVYFPEETARAVDLIAGAGLLGYSVERKYGGLNLPYAIQMSFLELLSRADGAFGITIGCYNLAEVIERFCDDETKSKYIPKMCSGEIVGAMALTEPNYGSDLTKLMTKAEKVEEGVYKLTGTKRFITHGCGLNDRPAVILTLARSGGSGAKGVSFFVVDSSEIEVARIEEKMGLHCSPTCEIVYENSRAEIIGEEGRGLVKYAMDMMNGARIGIAVQALGIAQAALAESTKYASERVQFGVPIEELSPVARDIAEMTAKVQAMRALVYHTAELVEYYDGNVNKLKAEGQDDRSIRKNPEVMKYDKLTKLMTPVSKLFCSEEANNVAYTGLQLFGGSGYTEEYDAARIYRDARITTIYEGTSHLQVVAAIGPIVQGMTEGNVIYDYLIEIAGEIGGSEKDKIVTHTKELSALTAEFKEKDKKLRDAIASDLVWYYSWLVTYALLAKQAKIAAEKGVMAEEKKQVLETYRLLAGREMTACKYHIQNS